MRQNHSQHLPQLKSAQLGSLSAEQVAVNPKRQQHEVSRNTGFEHALQIESQTSRRLSAGGSRMSLKQRRDAEEVDPGVAVQNDDAVKRLDNRLQDVEYSAWVD